MEIIDLTATVGPDRARHHTAAAIAEVTADALPRFRPS
jgi:hypothetical protein